MSVASGRLTTNRLPCGRPARSGCAPPCSSVRLRASVRPRPRPPCWRAIDRGPCVNGSKIVGTRSAGTPGPSSSQVISTRPRRHSDVSARCPPGRRVPRRVGQQIHEDLDDAVLIAVDRESGVRDADVERVPCAARPAAAPCPRRDRSASRSLEPAPDQIDLAARQPRDVEQVVHQPRHVRDLALEDLALTLQRGAAAQLHQLEGRQRRRQRIAQLVAEHRQEPILGAAGLLRLRLRHDRALELFVAFAVAIRAAAARPD